MFSVVMVKMLMGCKKLNLDAKNEQGRNAVHVAAMHDQLEIMKILLHKHEYRLEHLNFKQDGQEGAFDNNGMIALHFAVQRNNFEMVKFLIEHKALEIAIGQYK